jgi:hypothetical protein
MTQGREGKGRASWTKREGKRRRRWERSYYQILKREEEDRSEEHQDGDTYSFVFKTKHVLRT